MKKVVFYSTLFGADLTLISDTVSRSIIPSGSELPVGIITSIVGGSFFIYILIKRKERIWNG
jgi:iron complex transport system permease protein